MREEPIERYGDWWNNGALTFNLHESDYHAAQFFHAVGSRDFTGIAKIIMEIGHHTDLALDKNIYPDAVSTYVLNFSLVNYYDAFKLGRGKQEYEVEQIIIELDNFKPFPYSEGYQSYLLGVFKRGHSYYFVLQVKVWPSGTQPDVFAEAVAINKKAQAFSRSVFDIFKGFHILLSTGIGSTTIDVPLGPVTGHYLTQLEEGLARHNSLRRATHLPDTLEMEIREPRDGAPFLPVVFRLQ